MKWPQTLDCCGVEAGSWQETKLFFDQLEGHEEAYKGVEGSHLVPLCVEVDT